MAIRDVVTRGFGNGTYDPGVNDLPTRGYTIGAAAAAPDPTVRVVVPARADVWTVPGRGDTWAAAARRDVW